MVALYRTDLQKYFAMLVYFFKCQLNLTGKSAKIGPEVVYHHILKCKML